MYYSKTGRTKRVAQYIGEKLAGQGVHVDVYEVRHAREYARIFLHFNPRLIRDTLSGKQVEIEVIPGFKPKEYDIAILGSPIWYDKVVPAIRTFITRYRDKLPKDVACFTTSTLRRDYASGFKKLLESLGYRVIASVSIYNPDKDRGFIDRLVANVIEYLKTRR